ncbi:MAG: serine/threonine protein kinase [Candidatus Melainabacteria bacterium]|nr:serine/threonine protein kinase [Candidatus Melainabacteria bacterium]
MPDDKSLTAARKTCSACKRNYFANLSVCPNCGEKNRDSFIGRTISDRFLVESVIGEGGMGVVYKAWEDKTKQGVAIKILRQQFINDELAVKRFKHEAIAASRLSHPHIVALHDYGSTVDGYLFMVMEIIDGKSLAQVVRDKRSLGVARAVKIITQACEALDHAHQRGVIHRDLKPGNILLTEYDGEQDYVKLVDFGIAKLLINDGEQAVDTDIEQKGEVLGSPLYMSPEQCLGRKLDGRSDIYSLGIVTYETLIGKVPHIGRTAQETIEMQIQKEPMSFNAKRPDLYIPERLEAVVLKALAKDPASRQQTMKEFADELEAAISKKNDALEIRPSIGRSKKTPSSNPVVSNKRRNIIGVAIGFLVALVLAGLAFKNSLSQVPSNSAPSNPAPLSTEPTNTSTSTVEPSNTVQSDSPTSNTQSIR